MAEKESGTFINEYDDLVAYRARLVDHKDSQIRELDKSLLYMSGAALSLSIIFIEKIGGDKRSHFVHSNFMDFIFTGNTY